MGWVQEIDYIVEQQEGHWTISFQAEHCGRFGSRREALRAALWDAERVRRLGHRVRVLVRFHDGRLRDVATSRLSSGQVADGAPALIH